MPSVFGQIEILYHVVRYKKNTASVSAIFLSIIHTRSNEEAIIHPQHRFHLAEWKLSTY
jgi:hypothetical protein